MNFQFVYLPSLIIFLMSNFIHAEEERIPSNREIALQTVQKNFTKLRQRMKAVEEEYVRKGINLDPIKSYKPIPSPPPPSERVQLDLKVDKQSPSGRFKELKKPGTVKNSLGFYIGPTIPHFSEFSNQNGKFMTHYETGVNIRADYRRFYGNLFWGLGMDAKFFNTKQIEINQFGSTGAGGKNSTLSPFISFGFQRSITEQFSWETDVSIGYASTRKSLVLNGDNLSDTFETTFYYGAMIGLGWQWSEYHTASIFYRFDGLGEAGNFSDQFFNQAGIRIEIKY